MRACVQCGADNPDGADSCRSCGSVQLSAPSAAPVISASTAPSNAGQPSPSAAVPAAEGFGAAPSPTPGYEQTQPAMMATSQAYPPNGGAPAAELFRSEQRPHPASTLRRGEALVLVGAVLLFIASFLPFYDTTYGPSENAWTWFLLPLLVLGFGSGVLAGVLVALHRFTTGGDVAARIGLSLDQLVGVLAVVSAVDLLLSVISAPLHGVAQWLGLVAAALLLVGSVFATQVPALMESVGTTAPAGHGAAPMAFGATAWSPPQASAPSRTPAPAPGPETTAAPATGAAPFWFSVSAPALVHDRADGSVRGELQPGRWYLATVSFGTAVEVSADEFGTAILHDLSVLQRA
jgi:hypothetical protein